MEAKSCRLSQICLLCLWCVVVWYVKSGKAFSTAVSWKGWGFFCPKPAALAPTAQWGTAPVSGAQRPSVGQRLLAPELAQHRGRLRGGTRRAPQVPRSSRKHHPAHYQVPWIPLAAPCDPCTPCGLTGRSAVMAEWGTPMQATPVHLSHPPKTLSISPG